VREPQETVAQVRLRPSRPADLAFVTRLERDPGNRDFIGQWSDEEHLAAMAGEGAREHWIIQLDGAPAGYLIAYDGRDHYPGFYVKRIVVADKGRGTGQAALARFLDAAFEVEGVDFVWLLVRDWNERAQAVYRKLGFSRYEPSVSVAGALARAGDVPLENSFRMRIEAAGITTTTSGTTIHR
jgi:ribosomal protein S18 acetylase RimI-like enzyme